MSVDAAFSVSDSRTSKASADFVPWRQNPEYELLCGEIYLFVLQHKKTL
jgi:hypothetical protein